MKSWAKAALADASTCASVKSSAPTTPGCLNSPLATRRAARTSTTGMPRTRIAFNAPAAATAPTAEKVTFSADAFFDFDKAVLKPEGKATLQNLVGQLKGTDIEVIVATGHNNLAINRSVKQVAQHFVDGAKLQEGMLNRVSAVVREHVSEQRYTTLGQIKVDFALDEALTTGLFRVNAEVQDEFPTAEPTGPSSTRRGFTALIILVKITKKTVAPLCSSYVHVIGDELDWGQVTTMLAGSGMKWDGAAFFPKRDQRDNGPLDTPAARQALINAIRAHARVPVVEVDAAINDAMSMVWVLSSATLSSSSSSTWT